MPPNTTIPNRLIDETSPYLKQHAFNPVDWWPWCDAAFDAAREQDKPVFLSSGYASCHWCHVMEEESFCDSDIAALLNDRFIAVKLDREERPDVDAVYMDACMALNGSGGWPLTCLLTPDRRPIYAGTYFAPRDMGGRIGLMTLLERIDALWRRDRDKLLRSTDALLAAIAPAHRGGSADQSLERAALGFLTRAYDRVHGGFGGAPKFPTPHQLLFLLHSGTSEHRNMALHTLDALRDGGLCDHIGGGFFRYATDAAWRIPHFEKMLYDQAMLLWAYAAAHRATGGCEAIIRETYGFIQTALKAPGGAYMTSIDADAAGEEGLPYTHTPRVIHKILGAEDGARFCELMGITGAVNVDGAYVSHRTRPFDADDEAFLKRVRPSLLIERNARPRPRIDNKLLAADNALTVTALCEAGLALGEDAMVGSACKAMEFLLAHHLREGRLLSSYAGGRAAHPAPAEAYAFMAHACVMLHQARLEPHFLERAVFFFNELARLFSRGGVLHRTGADVGDLPVESSAARDGAVPSALGVACLTGFKLFRLTGDPAYRDTALSWLDAVAGDAESAPHDFVSAIDALGFFRRGGKDIVLTTGAGFSDVLALARSHGDALITVVGTGYDDIRRLVPYTADIPVDGRARMYLCENGVCSLPGLGG